MWSDARRGKWWCMWIATGGEVQRDEAEGGGWRGKVVWVVSSQKAETPAGDAREIR